MQDTLGLWKRIGAGDAHEVEAERIRSLADMFGKRTLGCVCDRRSHVARMQRIQKSPRLVTKGTLRARTGALPCRVLVSILCALQKVLSRAAAAPSAGL